MTATNRVIYELCEEHGNDKAIEILKRVQWTLKYMRGFKKSLQPEIAICLRDLIDATETETMEDMMEESIHGCWCGGCH